MSLLEVITKASSNTQTGPDPDTNYPVTLNPDPIFLTLKPETNDSNDQSPVKRVTGWAIPAPDTQLIEASQKFSKKLKRNLKNTNRFTKDAFLGMFSEYLEKIGDKFGISVRKDKLDEAYVSKLIEMLGLLMGKDVKGLVLEACVSLEAWELLKYLIRKGVIEHERVPSLVTGLVRKCTSDLIVSCVKYLPDIPTYELMCILKYFLVPPREGYESMVSVRNEWEEQALLAIEKVSGRRVGGKKERLEKDAAVLVMVAHDMFSVSELCLHYFFASPNFDEVIFSACVSKLNAEEMMALVRYLGKWLSKYDRFPQVVPCPKASSSLGLEVCDWVPKRDNVMKCLGLVVDEHFSSLVLQAEFLKELRSLAEVINSLAAEARLCGTLASLAGKLRDEQMG